MKADLRSQHHPWIPCLAAAAAYVLLLGASWNQWDGITAAATIWAVGLTALAAVRQTRLSHDNARLQAEAAARHSEQRFRSLVQHSSDVVAILDPDSSLGYVSPSSMRTLGYAPEALLGTALLSLLHPDDQPQAVSYLAQAAQQPGTLPGSVWRLRHADGSWRHAHVTGASLLDDPSVGGVVLNLRDISDRVELEAQLSHQAFHDALTGLANRALFRNRLEHALARDGRRHEGVAVILLDLDDFKAVNDGLGHAQGDSLLVSVSARLLNATRGCDTVARLGGDEFAVLLDRIHDDAEAVTVAERILGMLGEPFRLEGKEVRVSASLGIARQRPGEGAEELLRNADVAMYQAKRQGKAGYEIFAPEMHAAVLDRIELEADLRQAVAHPEGELHLVYQPIVALPTGKIIGVEALARWKHPRRGMVSPGQFIPVAEETGLIVPLGRWVLEEACRQAAAWYSRGVVPDEGENGEPSLVLSVNLSGRQLQDPGLVAEVTEVLHETGLDPRCLLLEITESVLMRDTDQIIAALNALKRLGIRLAIDDFGTGYSSLSYLRRFPVDVLKIDKAFVDGVANDSQAAALARTIVALGETLSLHTVAEGIEGMDQLQHLRVLGCGFGQGYLFARPMPPEEISDMLGVGHTSGLPAMQFAGS